MVWIASYYRSRDSINPTREELVIQNQQKPKNHPTNYAKANESYNDSHNQMSPTMWHIISRQELNLLCNL